MLEVYEKNHPGSDLSMCDANVTSFKPEQVGSEEPGDQLCLVSCLQS